MLGTHVTALSPLKVGTRVSLATLCPPRLDTCLLLATCCTFTVWGLQSLHSPELGQVLPSDSRDALSWTCRGQQSVAQLIFILSQCRTTEYSPVLQKVSGYLKRRLSGRKQSSAPRTASEEAREPGPHSSPSSHHSRSYWRLRAHASPPR